MRITLSMLILSALLASPLASAKIYKSVLPDGSVTYSDKPQPGAESVKLPPIQTYTPRPVPKAEDKVEQAPADPKAYESVRITSPTANETIRDNGGTISVQVEVKPKLMPGHQLEVIVDGKVVGSGAATSLSISNLDRGSHSVSANIKDDKGRVVKSAGGVSFQLHRSSKLSPTRRPKPSQ